jgi:hypothetical protein
MGLCDPGDKVGACIFTMGQADEHYATWHKKTEPQKKQLIEQFKAKYAEVCVSPLRYPIALRGRAMPCSLDSL